MAVRLHFVKWLSAFFVNRHLPRELLPTTHDSVDIARIDLKAIANSADTLSCDYSRATTQKWIQHNITARGAIEKAVADHSCGLDRRVQSREIAFGRRFPESPDR